MKTAVYFILIIVFTLSFSIPGFSLTREPKETPIPETPSTSSPSPGKEKLDINTASLQALLLIPEITEEQVLAIIHGRPYETLDDVLDIPEIDHTALENLQEWITVIPVEIPVEETKEEQKKLEEREREKEKREAEREREEEKREAEREREEEKREAEREREEEKREAEREKE